MYAQFNRFEIQMTMRQAKTVSHSGDCEADTKALAKNPKIIKQFNKIPANLIAKELKEYGA